MRPIHEPNDAHVPQARHGVEPQETDTADARWRPPRMLLVAVAFSVGLWVLIVWSVGRLFD